MIDTSQKRKYNRNRYLGGDLMKKWICAKDVTSLAVIELMYGKKTKVAVKTENGNFEVQTKSIITQYLNPNNDRKKMTKRIADTVCNNFEYYMKDASSKENFSFMCGKALLFIYSISKVDLTYILQNQYSSSAKEEISAFLLKVVRSVFEGFVQRECIQYSELKELVYTTIFDKNIFDEITKDTTNDIDISRSTYMQYLPMLDSSCSIAGEVSDVLLTYLTELILADSREEFIQTHAVSGIVPFAENFSGIHWKERCFQQRFGTFLLFQPNSMIRKEGNYLLEKIRLQLYKNAIYTLLKKYDTIENRSLKQSSYFQDAMSKLENYTNFIKLQVKTDKELELFGRFKIYRKVIDTPRKLITEMMDFVFYGVYAKVGRVELIRRNGKKHEILTEVSRDYISKYVNGEQKKFTGAVKDALYYRIKYNIENKEHFVSLLWQFMYYAFSLDFYMVESEEDWLRLMKKMLEDVECGKSMENLREDMQMSFDEWQLKKILYNQTIKFPPLTIKYFRHIDASGWIRYTEVQSRILNIDNGFDTVQIRNEMTIRYIDLKIDRLMEKLYKTVELAEKSFSTRSHEEIKAYKLQLGDEQTNWKIQFLSNLCDENDNKIALSEGELKELLSYISMLIISNRIHSENCNKRKEEFEIYAKRIFNLKSVRYETIYGLCKTNGDRRNKELFDRQNAELWKSKVIQNLYKWVKRILEYLVYSEWIDEHWNHI